MIPIPQRPPFWLRIKKEYILDNFEDVIQYLRKYPCSPDTPAPDYDDTLNCLTECIEDITAVMDAAPLYAGLPGKPDTARTMRMMGAALLAASSRGVTRHDIMLALIGFILRDRDDIKQPEWRELWRIAVASSIQRPVKSIGFQWNDIAAENFSPSIFIYRLCLTAFDAAESPAFAYDGKGLLTAGDDCVTLAPANRNDLAKKQFTTLFDIDGLVRVNVADSIKRGSYENLSREAKFAIKALEQVRPSQPPKIKEYTDSDTFVVKVISKSGAKIIAETVDSSYSRLEGKLLIRWNTPFRPDDATMRNDIKPGDMLLARKSATETCAFDTSDTFEEFYRDYSGDYADDTDTAIFDRKISEGSAWITAGGFRVIMHNNIYDNLGDDDREAVDKAMMTGTPLRIRFYREPQDKEKLQFKIYVSAEPSGSPAEPFTRDHADLEFLNAFRNEAAATARERAARMSAMATMTPRAARTIAALLYNASLTDRHSPSDRLGYITAAAMACTIVGRRDTAAYLMYLMSFGDRLVDFCHNREVKPLKADPALADAPLVETCREVTECLAAYVNPTAAGTRADRRQKPDTVSRVATLVKASNSLLGIIGGPELNNIKKSIARILGAEDEFEPLISDRTFYGNESDSLEFKTSIVFPPENRRRGGKEADPDLQKWAVLKAVCAMLNSRAGGDVLLGVSDEGYAKGLDDDIAALSRMRIIASPDMDHYRLHLQRVINFAFKEYGESTLSTDITALNITYIPETNTEGKTILRIHVTPYPYGVVGFVDSLERPDDIAEAYVRIDGSSQRLTAALREKVEQYKLEASVSAERDIVVAASAINDRRTLLLAGYVSGSGRRDRTIEPYKIWKKRGLVYGYDLESQQARLYKITRAESVTPGDTRWTTPRVPVDAEIDPFGMLVDRKNAHLVELHLTDYARQLLLEEFPGTPVEPVRNGGRHPWSLTCRVSSFSGIARFVMGLPGEVKVVRNDEFKAMLRDRARHIADE